MHVQPVPKVSTFMALTTKTVTEKAKKWPKMAIFWPKSRYNGRVMARGVSFYQCIWGIKFWAKFGCSWTPRTASVHNSFIVLRCMWKEPALLRIASSAVCKINQHNQWVVCEGKSCVKTCSRCYCGLPSGSSGDHIFIWYLDYHDFHGHHGQSSPPSATKSL